MEEIFYFFFHEEEIIFHDGITEEFITFAKGGGGSGSNASDGEWRVKLHSFVPCCGAWFLTGYSWYQSAAWGLGTLMKAAWTVHSNQHHRQQKALSRDPVCIPPSWVPLLLLAPHDQNVHLKANQVLRWEPANASQCCTGTRLSDSHSLPSPASWLLLHCPRWGPLSAPDALSTWNAIPQGCHPPHPSTHSHLCPKAMFSPRPTLTTLKNTVGMYTCPWPTEAVFF